MGSKLSITEESIVKIFKYDIVKEGPCTFSSPKASIGLFFSLYKLNFWKLITLNLLFIAFCIPVITIPAAISSMMYVLRNMVDATLVFIWHDFWKAFKENFIKSLIAGIIFLLVIFVAYLFIPYYIQLKSNGFIMIMAAAFCLAAFIFFLMQLYVPLMIVSVDLPLITIYNNALRLTFISFFKSLLTFIIAIVLLGLCLLYFPVTILFLAVFTFSTIGFIVTFNTWPVIKKYVIAE